MVCIEWHDALLIAQGLSCKSYNHVCCCALMLQVLKVVRVQNTMLWLRYALRKREMQDQLGIAGKQQRLHHGGVHDALQVRC
jgi:hypothetical protein